MRELVIVAKCDRCDAHVDSDTDPVTHTIDNRTVETDLCEKCGAEWEAALSDFFRGARPVAKTRGKKARSKPKAATGGSIPCKHKTCKRTFDTPQGASLHYRRTHGG